MTDFINYESFPERHSAVNNPDLNRFEAIGQLRLVLVELLEARVTLESVLPHIPNTESSDPSDLNRIFDSRDILDLELRSKQIVSKNP